jgi:hypothetical protein
MSHLDVTVDKARLREYLQLVFCYIPGSLRPAGLCGQASNSKTRVPRNCGVLSDCAVAGLTA